jgi:hypothetical protein
LNGMSWMGMLGSIFGKMCEIQDKRLLSITESKHPSSFLNTTLHHFIFVGTNRPCEISQENDDFDSLQRVAAKFLGFNCTLARRRMKLNREFVFATRKLSSRGVSVNGPRY